FAFQILDENGKALSKSGLSNRSGGNIQIDMPANKETADYTLEIIPAFTNKELSANLSVNEVTYLPAPQTVSVKHNGRNILTLYPNSIKYIDVDFYKPELIIPADAEGYGKIYFKSPTTEKTEYELPINFKF
ncbi:MAG: hypothetical protein RBR74_07375, partial [Ignavibacteriaceae bacterium]|nr:hypothetical protein [Ignavibacteriaceae bacterium]